MGAMREGPLSVRATGGYHFTDAFRRGSDVATSGSARDQWELGADQLVEGASEALRQFFVLDIEMTQPRLSVSGDSAEVRCRPRLSGSGTSLAQMLMERSSALQQDTVLTWRRESWKPWDWKLVSISQPEVDLSTARDAVFRAVADDHGSRPQTQMPAS
jgi:hypothetical protein